ncbi:hypothetical protein C8R43DRAFT_944883 [Mycena crocata]|nr:hypothetical protein C8R43DRAFT_944883 [Mycena crocata]
MPDFDVGPHLPHRPEEQAITCGIEEEEATMPFSSLPNVSIDTHTPTASPPANLLTSLSAKEHNKVKYRARRHKKCDTAREASDNPLLKGINTKHVNESKSSALELDLDASNLPQSKPAWLGSRAAGEEEFEFSPPQAPHNLDTALAGRSYSQAEVDALSGTEGFMYIGWLGRLTIPISDILGGMGWVANRHRWCREANGRAALEDPPHGRAAAPLTCADDSFPALAHGGSHGGGQTPGKLCNNVANTKLTNELLAHDYFEHITQFACTITAPHLDFANLAWGWCAITALGIFDPDLGGHLILWDLRLVIRFPPGSTVLLPSALIRPSNVAIRHHESRCSFTQYTAGGIFC